MAVIEITEANIIAMAGKRTPEISSSFLITVAGISAYALFPLIILTHSYLVDNCSRANKKKMFPYLQNVSEIVS